MCGTSIAAGGACRQSLFLNSFTLLSNQDACFCLTLGCAPGKNRWVNRFLSALLGGRLLKPVQLAEMRKTERAEPYEIVYREPGYGLGLMKRRTSCGEEVWFHGGGI